jgi:hypothetical protein
VAAFFIMADCQAGMQFWKYERVGKALILEVTPGDVQELNEHAVAMSFIKQMAASLKEGIYHELGRVEMLL